VERVFHCGGEYTEESIQTFVEMFPEFHVPHRNIMRQLIDKFRETGSVADAQRSSMPRVLSEHKSTGHF
jgi:hypothetical protein